MRRVLWFFIGSLALLLLQAVAARFLLVRALAGSARQPPTAIEGWLARRARSAAIAIEMKNRTNPVPNTDQILGEARAHWADHCAFCHANDGSGQTRMGKQMYPPTPDMREAATQSLTDGELFNIIQNGVRLTGMPAWGGSDHDSKDSWKLVRFIRHLPSLTLQERTQMERLNPKGPDERKEEEEEEQFLRGETVNEPEQHHHH